MSDVSRASKYQPGRPACSEELIEKTHFLTYHNVLCDVSLLLSFFHTGGGKVNASNSGLSH